MMAATAVQDSRLNGRSGKTSTDGKGRQRRGGGFEQ
jgi:hypothetical protein